MTKSKAQQGQKFPCVICDADVTTKQGGVECSLCRGWTHVSCPGGSGPNVSKALVDVMAADKGASLSFFCINCRPNKEKVFDSFRELEKFKIEVADQIAGLQLQVDELRRQKNPTIDFKTEISEFWERDKKKLNVVLVGVPENDLTKTVCEEDENHVKGICESLNVDFTAVKRVFRDGKIPSTGSTPSGHPYSRIIKIFFGDKDSKMNFLKGYRGARDHSMRSYARHDLTYMQRMEDKALRNEVEAKRLSNPSMFYYIRGGRIESRPKSAPNPNIVTAISQTASQLTYGQPPSQ